MAEQRRSKLEERFESILVNMGVPYEYEVTKIPYIVPSSDHKYTVDFTVNQSLLIECKGYLSDHQERYKYLLVQAQHPEIDLRFVFVDPNKLCGGTKYSHGEWATKHNFKWCSIKDTDTIKEWTTHGT